MMPRGQIMTLGHHCFIISCFLQIQIFHRPLAFSNNQSALESILLSVHSFSNSASYTVLNPAAQRLRPGLFAPLPIFFVCQLLSRIEAFRDCGMIARFPNVSNFESRCLARSSEEQAGQLFLHFFGIRCSKLYLSKPRSIVALLAGRILLSIR